MPSVVFPNKIRPGYGANRVIAGEYSCARYSAKLVNILGGLMAFLAPAIRSEKSLIVGGASGLILLYFAWVAETKPGFAFRGAAFVAAGPSGLAPRRWLVWLRTRNHPHHHPYQ